MYNLFDGLSHKVINNNTGFLKYGRESTAFDMTSVALIDKRPLYYPNSEKIINIIEYMQMMVCQSLRNDLKSSHHLEIYGGEMPGHFYTSKFPFVGWRILTDGMDIKVFGCVWVNVLLKDITQAQWGEVTKGKRVQVKPVANDGHSFITGFYPGDFSTEYWDELLRRNTGQ